MPISARSAVYSPTGFAFVHCIGRMRPPGSTGPFIRKYIFPGAYVPSLSEVFAATERAGLWVADMEVLRLHNHYTLQHWRRRFAANHARAADLYDERFCRMWEYYLAAVDVGFSTGSNMVFHRCTNGADRKVRSFFALATGCSPLPIRLVIDERMHAAIHRP
jgi:cyclopropane fatty-acyl-phospholipid synthase-like methyltransferase